MNRNLSCPFHRIWMSIVTDRFYDLLISEILNYVSYLYLHFLFCDMARITGHCSHFQWSLMWCLSLSGKPALLQLCSNYFLKEFSFSSSPPDGHSQEVWLFKKVGKSQYFYFSFSWFDVSLQYSILLWFCYFSFFLVLY